MRQTVEATDHFCAGTKPEHAIHESDLFFRVLSLLQQPLDHVAIDRHRAPRHGSIQEHANQFGTLERVKLFLTEPHRLTAAQLAVAQIVQRLGNNGLIQRVRSEEHTSELQSLMRISYAVFCLKKKK